MSGSLLARLSLFSILLLSYDSHAESQLQLCRMYLKSLIGPNQKLIQDVTRFEGEWDLKKIEGDEVDRFALGTWKLAVRSDWDGEVNIVQVYTDHAGDSFYNLRMENINGRSDLVYWRGWQREQVPSAHRLTVSWNGRKLRSESSSSFGPSLPWNLFLPVRLWPLYNEYYHSVLALEVSEDGNTLTAIMTSRVDGDPKPYRRTRAIYHRRGFDGINP